MYSVEWTEKAKKNLDRIHPVERVKIIYKVENKLAKDPYKGGNIKPLKGREWQGQYRYRTGDYRIIYKIFPDKIVIEILEVGHRREIY